MKRISTFLISLVFLLAVGQVYGATIYMPYTYDDDNPRTAVITEKSTLTYQGYWTEEEMYEPAFIYLKPSSGGKLRLTIESTASFPEDGLLRVYNGMKDISSGWKYVLPGGDMGAVKVGAVFDSTADDGSLTVAWYEEEGNYYKWKATVEELSSADMSVVSTTVVDLSSSQALVGAKSQALAAINVKTEGGKNPLSLTGLDFNINSANSGKFSNLKTVYTEGNAAYDAATAQNLTGSQQLKGGDNYFWVVGDVDASATVGETIGVEFSSVKVGGEEKLTSPLVSESVKVGNELLMPKSGTFTVGYGGYVFYDDGGKDGKISSKFEGTVTFVPVDPTKKVMIDFSKVGLYEATYGSDSYDDKIYVYNGTTTASENLNQQVKNNQPVVVRSASDDGALTVKLTSVTGDYYRGSGFEAAVSQFAAQTMTVKSISAAQYSAGTVSGGDLSQPILSVIVETENTAPALTASKFNFTAAGTSANVAKASVYYTGINSAFATTKKVGEVEVGSDAFEVTATEPVTLAEGKNYFWLAYDIAESAADGSKVDASVASVTLSDAVHAVDAGNPDGDREVLNLVYATLGNTTKVVYGSTLFKSEPYDSESYDCYDPTVGDRVVTFVPATAGNVIELDFSSFDVTYNSSSYGVKAKFEVYSGKTATGSPLWKLDSPEAAKVGPGKLLRSAAVDGSLTVVFNTVDGNTYYAGKGWTATAREYKSKLMEVKSIEVAQASTDVAANGKPDQEILKVKVTTEGDRNPLAVNKLSLDLKGSQSAIGKVKVYSTATSETFATTTLVGSADVDGSSSVVEVEFPNPVILVEGTGIYWIAFDVKEDAVPGTALDAKLVSVTVENNTVAVENGDPEGSREIKNIYLMPTSGTETVAVGDYAYLFYDDGGADGDYSKVQNGTVTFAPKKENSVIRFTFNKFNNSSGAYLMLYSGKEATDENLLGKYDMYSKPEIGSSVSSKSDDGAITVKFENGGYIESEGWEIEVAASEIKPLSVGSIKATVATEKTELLGGVSNEPMLRVAVAVDGDRGSLSVDELSFAVANSSNLSGMKVFYTGTSEKFGTDAQFGAEQTGDAPVFAGAQEIKEPGMHYFWLAASVKNDAEVGASITFAQTGAKVGGAVATIEESETASISIKNGFSGTYTVGTGGDYATIAAAIDAVKDGINGAVVFNVKNGSYKEELVIPEIPGASEVNTITLKSESGNYGDVTITSDNHTSGYNDDNSAVLTVFGADYLTIEGFTFTNPDATYNYLVDIKNASNYVTVRNCYFKADVYTSDPYYSDAHRLLHTNFVNNPVANTPDTYLTLDGNIFEGGYVGVDAGGASVSDRSKGTRIIGNTFKNQWSQAMLLSYEESGEISGNVITGASSSTKGFTAIDLNNTVSTTVSGNSVTTASAYVVGIKLRPAAGTADKHVRVFNNVLNLKSLDSSSSAYGLSITGGSSNNKVSNIDIAYNTIRLSGSNTTKSAGIYNISNFSESITVQNNIVQNEAGGYTYWINSKPLKATALNNNSLFTSGDVFAKNYNTSENWITGSNEADSKVQKVEFLSDDVLSPKSAEGLTFAKPLDYVAVDIAGTERDKQNPTVGAYEFVVEKAPEMMEGYPKLSGDTGLDRADIAVKTTANAYVNYLVTTSAEVPSKEDVLASGLKVEASKGQEAIIAVTGLEASTEYHAYFVLGSMTSDLTSDVISMSAFSTKDPEPEPLELSVEDEEITVTAGATVAFKAIVAGGVAPYAYSWKNAMQEEVATSATCEFAAETSGDYVVTVTDSRMETATAKVRLVVTGEAKVATFDDLYLAPDSYWMGEEDGASSFISGSYQFSNYYMPDYYSWAFFGYSNLTQTTFDMSNFTNDQFASVVGHGVDNSSNYAVVYADKSWGPCTLTVLNNPEGDEVKGCYVTNTAWVAYVKDHGTGMDSDDAGANEPFKTGDYFKVTATADNGNSAEFYLVDYRTDDSRVFVDDWKWFDLSGLGKVKTITFAVDGTRRNTYGSTIPSYFCMDDFNGINKDGGVESISGNGRIYLAGDVIKFEQYAGFEFNVFTIGGQMVDTFTVTENSQAMRAGYVKGVYLIVGTDGNRTVTQKVIVR